MARRSARVRLVGEPGLAAEQAPVWACWVWFHERAGTGEFCRLARRFANVTAYARRGSALRNTAEAGLRLSLERGKASLDDGEPDADDLVGADPDSAVDLN